MHRTQDSSFDREPSTGRHPSTFRKCRKDQLDTQAESALWIEQLVSDFEDAQFSLSCAIEHGYSHLVGGRA